MDGRAGFGFVGEEEGCYLFTKGGSGFVRIRCKSKGKTAVDLRLSSRTNDA